MSKPRSVATGLFFVALAAYLLTYVGAFKINDERALFASLDSFWKRGEFTTNQIYWDYTNVGMLTTTGEMVPNYEPAQIVLALPLYAWGRALGATVQAVMLWGPLVTAASVALLYLTMLELGYRRRAALLAACVFAFGTIVWAYSKTFYRDPLAMLMYQLAIYAALRYRAPPDRGWRWPAVMGAALGIALTTKQVSVVIIPALLLLVGVAEWRQPSHTFTRLRAALAAVVPLAIILLLYQVYYQQTLAGVEMFARNLPEAITNAQLSSTAVERMVRAALGIMISPFRGIFFYAPALLLAIVGALPFLKRHPWEGLAFGSIVVAHVLGYSRYLYWAGGAAYGSRYMLATIPFLVLIAAPVWDWLTSQRATPRRWVEQAARLTAWGLIFLSVAFQLPGALMDMVTFEHRYFTEQGPRYGGIGEAIDATYLAPSSSTVFGNARLLAEGTEPLDVAWVQRRDEGRWALIPSGLLLTLGYLGLALLLFRWLWRRPRHALPGTLGMGAITIGVLSLLLVFYREGDRRFDPYNVDRFLRPMLPTLEEVSCEPGPLGHPGRCDAVMVAPDPLLTDYFLTLLRAPLPWYALPVHPGPEDFRLLDRLVERYPTIYLVRDRSAAADSEQGRRAVEQYLTERAYKVGEEQVENWARLIRFSAAGTTVERIESGESLGEMTLVEADLRLQLAQSLPPGAMTTPVTPREPLQDERVVANTGELLQLRLTWRAAAPPEANYTAFVQLLDANDQVATQLDRWPGDGLFPTGELSEGETLTDNLALPLELPPGTYHLITGFYRADAEGLPRLTGATGDHIALATVEIPSTASPQP